jgi:inhibitor of the pro-sigma K processing machinery
MNWKPEGDIWLWAVLACAITILAIMAFRSKNTIRWAGYALMNLLFAAVALYLVNAVGILGELRIPLNLPNVAIIGVLGIPGVALVAALHGLVLR